VVENVPLAERTFRLRLVAPTVAARIRPGQFVMVRLPGNDPLLGRPFALYDTFDAATGQRHGLEVVYLVVGKLTTRLADLSAGARVELVGPLGQPFPDLLSPLVNCVAGGIGQTPFVAYTRHLLGTRSYGGQPAQRRADAVRLYYGVRTQRLAASADFLAAGADVRLATDDGSAGFAGRVTTLLEQEAPAGPLLGCGPEPMLHALTELAQRWQRPCWVSLETPMACGVGACFSCVTRVRTVDGWDYRRVCVEGPTFPAEQLVW
jgi:dihydroorotate dehydrogenase electron transfer subunit